MSNNYFQLFDLPKQFDLNQVDLDRAYFALQAKYHPDRMIGKSEEERQVAAQQSVRANDGYQILSSPIKRAQYLLALSDIRVNGEHDNVKPSHTLLSQLMEWREQLSEHHDMMTLQMQINDELNRSYEALPKAFRESTLMNAAEITIRLHYLTKLAADLRAKPVS